MNDIQAIINNLHREGNKDVANAIQAVFDYVNFIAKKQSKENDSVTDSLTKLWNYAENLERRIKDLENDVNG